MQRTIAKWCAVACLLLVGCSSATAEQPQPAATGMGMDAAADSPMVSGAVAAPENASLTIGTSAMNSEGVVVSAVEAPADCWLLVRSTTPPGAVLGSAWIRSGTSRDVTVPLHAVDGAEVRVALHVDRGAPKVLDFDPANPERSIDKPVVVERNALERRLSLESFGAEVVPNSALIKVEDQRAGDGVLTVDYLLLPRASWIAVNVLQDGVPGARIGLVSRGAGELQEVAVPLRSIGRPVDVVVTVHVDRGVAGRFEYDASDPLDAVDQPYKSAGVIVSRRIRLE